MLLAEFEPWTCVENDAQPRGQPDAPIHGIYMASVQWARWLPYSLGLSRCNMWDFCDRIHRERAERLHAYDSFAAVIALIVKNAEIAAFEWEAFHAERLFGCHRASFLLKVPEHAYDAFFNAPAGYRGQYPHSREVGEEANRSLLSNLEPLLLANPSSEQSTHGSLVLRSLRATDAKCWIFEREVEQHMGVDAPEILYSPWQNASDDGAGLRAPLGLHIEAKGGWLDARGTERRDPIKSSRSKEIHELGYS